MEAFVIDHCVVPPYCVILLEFLNYPPDLLTGESTSFRDGIDVLIGVSLEFSDYGFFIDVGLSYTYFRHTLPRTKKSLCI